MKYEQMKSILMTLDSPADKLEMVMDFGAHMPPVPDGAVCSEILGCASRAEICRDGNRLFGRADSAIVRGIIAILLAMVDGRSGQEIKNMDLEGEFASLDLSLGVGRLGGLQSMIRFLKNL